MRETDEDEVDEEDGEGLRGFRFSSPALPEKVGKEGTLMEEAM